MYVRKHIVLPTVLQFKYNITIIPEIPLYMLKNFIIFIRFDFHAFQSFICISNSYSFRGCVRKDKWQSFICVFEPLQAEVQMMLSRMRFGAYKAYPALVLPSLPPSLPLLASSSFFFYDKTRQPPPPPPTPSPSILTSPPLLLPPPPPHCPRLLFFLFLHLTVDYFYKCITKITL